MLNILATTIAALSFHAQPVNYAPCEPTVRVPDLRAFAAHQRDGLGAVVLEEDGLRPLHQVLVGHGARSLTRAKSISLSR